MDDRSTLRYDRAVRVKTFGQQNAADFATGSVARALFDENAQLIAAVDKAKATQKRSRDTGKEVLVDALRLDLQNIARTARTIAISEPGFADSYRIPEDAGEGILLTTGDAFVTALGKTGVAAKFISRELPATLVDDLKADLTAIRNYKGDTEAGRTDSVEATAAIQRLVKRSGQIVLELNAIMHNKYGRSNPDKLRGWKSASHLERMPNRPKPDDENPLMPPPPAPGTPPPSA